MDQSAVNEYSDITNRLNDKEPLTGKLLKTALGVIEESRKGFSDENMLDNIAKKLVSGQSLDDYEYHIVVDVLLLHKRLID